MSNKNLKDKIKRKTATQTFFNQYESTNENDNEVNNVDNINNDNDKTYVIDNNEDNINNVVDVYKNESITSVTPATQENTDEDYFRNLAQGRKPKRKKSNKVFTSFYMDPDLAEEVDRIAKNGVKGDKSRLINMGIRKLLQDYGVLQD